MEISIHPLTRSDVLLLRGMFQVFADAFEEERTYLSAQPSDEYLASLLGGESFLAVVALDGDTVIGGLAAYELRKFEQPRSEIYIYDLAVAASHRRRGVATALITRLKSVAASRGAYVIYVQADLVDAPAIALYAKLGLREDVLHFDIPVE